MARSRASANYQINATDRTRAGVQSAKGGFQSLDNTAAKLGVNFSLMGALGAAAPGLIISANAPLIDQMGKLSTQTGVSVEFIQAYRKQAALAGIDSGAFDTSIEKMSKRVSQASVGLGAARGSLDDLGLSAKELAKLNPEDQFYTISEALESVATEGAKARIASNIFGKSGESVIRANGEAIRKTRDELVALNAALSGADVSGVESMNDALFLVQNNATQASQIFTAQMAPAVTGVVNSIFSAEQSMGGLRDTSLDAADVFVDVIGAIGNGVEGLDNVFESIKIGLAATNVQANKAQDFFERSDASAERLADSMEDLQSLQDNLAGQVSDKTFWVQLEEQVESARESARQAAKEADDRRARFKAGIDTGLGDGQSNKDKAKSGPNDSAFQSLLDSLATGTEKIERAYEKRLSVIDDFQQAYPDRGEEALQAQIQAMQAYDDAIEKFNEDKGGDAERARLGGNADQVRDALATETEAIVEEYLKRSEMLHELGLLDVDRKAEVDQLMVQLAEDTGRRLNSIENASATKRKQIQTDYAAQALGVASSLVDSLGGQGERSKRAAARISQVEALVSGISAAERARNHASLSGGLVSGAAAAGLSWASTIANVAGIEAALSGGTPSGSSSSSGASTSGLTSDIQSGLEAGDSGESSVNVTFVFDDDVIDKEAVKRVAIKGIAEATQSRDLTYNDKRSYYEANDESFA